MMSPISSTSPTPEALQILLFGDLSTSYESQLRSLLHDSSDPLLQSFLSQVGASLRHEISLLSSGQQNLFPRFTTLIDLVSKLGEGADGTPILRFSLLAVCQLGLFIRRFNHGPIPYPSASNTFLLGLCTGAFPAAAVSVSRTLAELVPAGVEGVILAFRTALVSFTAASDSLSTAGGSKRSDKELGFQNWAAVVHSTPPEVVAKLIEDFVSSTPLTPVSTPYISALTPTHATISAPPPVLRAFLSHTNLKVTHIGIESPFHAPHLFHESTIDSILAHSNTTILSSYVPRIPLWSSSTGSPMEAADYGTLVRHVIHDTLRAPIQWPHLLSFVVSALKVRPYVSDCLIDPICSNAGSLLSTALSRDTDLKIALRTDAPPSSTSANRSPSESARPTGRFAESKIAIIGYSGRFPESTSAEEFWSLLRAGRDVHREIPADRFDWRTHYDPTGKAKNTSRVKYGCFIKEPGLFDAPFFNISPREAENTDPAQRLAITTTYEAMEMAGMVPNRTPSTQQDRIGVFFGVTSDDWREVNSGQKVDTYFIPGGNRAFVPGRISYFFRFSGPALSIDTACSSSFAAIQTACGYLWRGECDTAVAGGTNVLTNPDNFAGLDRGHFLSTTGNCNAFDDAASGYCRADAVGSVILKRLEDAEMDNDPILGVIAGAYTNHCGQTESITRPHEGDQASVFRRIIRHAKVDPLDIGYVEMHGTGTQAGDATEMNSVLSVFVPEQQRMPRYPLYLGSAKANIGHAESASGVSSLIKVLMMMKNSEIPPHCGIKTKINHNYPLDLKERNVNIAFKPIPWCRGDAASGKRMAFLNNFSAAGGNTAILLEDAPIPKPSEGKDTRTWHIVAVTAKTKKSLKGNVEVLADFLEKHPELSASSLSYTTTARRMHHNYRLVCSGNDTRAIASSLRAKAAAALNPKPIPGAAKIPKIAFVFTGQGSFYSGLGHALFHTVSSFRDDILRLDRMGQQHGFPSFLPVIIQDTRAADTGSDDPVITQLALSAVQMALSRLWRSWDIQPSLVTAHSLGEYAGLYAAGVLSASDAIFLVGTRAQLLARSCRTGTHSMLAVKASLDVTRAVLERFRSCEIACINQPTGNVVSGPRDDIAELEKAFRSKGCETVLLGVPYAFHSAQVEPILERFASDAKAVQYHAPSIPYASPLLGEIVDHEGILNSTYLAKACREAVNFQGAIESAKALSLVDNGTIWLEIGSHPACSGMIKGTLGSKSITSPSLQKGTDPWKVLTTTLEVLYMNGIVINWNEYHRDFQAVNRVIELPRYSWDLKNYWIMYKNDFCLTKGEVTVAGPQPVEQAPEARPSFKYVSPSAQRVLEESHGADTSSVLIESDIHDPRLAPVLSGHKVNGASLCPSSLYADIAMTLADYLLKGASRDADAAGLDVSKMNVQRPLISLPSATSQLFRVSARAEWASSTVSLRIYSVNEQGKKTVDHATCTVVITSRRDAWANEWKRSGYLIRSRIAALNKGVEEGDANKMKRGMVYKLFAALVDYGDEYQGMQEVVLDSNELEAVSTVDFRVGDQGYYFNPRWVDSLGHIAGFIMNGNDNTQSQAEVYINHGWDNMRCAKRFQEGRKYQAYNKMQLVEGTVYAGDTYILDKGEIIAVFEGVKFQGVPRRALDNLLPPSEKAKAAAAAPSAVARPSTTKGTPAKPVSAPIQAAKPAPAKPASSILSRILGLISEEVGVGLDELTPDCSFADFGLDSLLSLTVTGRIREEIGLELPSSLFVDFPNVGDLASYFGGDSRADVSSGSNSSSSSSPALPASSVSGDESANSSTLSTPPSEPYCPADGKLADVLNIVRSTISEETGVSLDDLEAGTRLADLGVDSLLGLTVTSILNEELDTELPSSLFVDGETLEEIEKAVCLALGLPKTTAPVAASPAAKMAQPPSTAGVHLKDPVVTSAPHASSILLQGSPSTATSRLFLFPDGSGSASSYASLAPVGPSVAVYGLNCPWRTSPDQMAKSGCTLAQLSAKFLVEVQRRQPKGPYVLGGWSAGGICAFEAARQLAAREETVEKLVLIDSPNPIGLQNPPARMYDFFQEMGVFGGGADTKIPAWLRGHFDAFIRMLDSWEPAPWPTRGAVAAPETVILYARDGVCKDPNGPRPEIRPDDPREMIWLLNDRTDFSAKGWKSLVGTDKLAVKILDGVNHFSMMEDGPRMAQMVGFVREHLEG